MDKEFSPAESQAVMNYISVWGVVDGGLGKQALSELNTAGLMALCTNEPSEIKMLFEIQQKAKDFTRGEGFFGRFRKHPGAVGFEKLIKDELQNGYDVQFDPRTFTLSKQSFDDMAADMQLSIEECYSEKPFEDPKITPEMYAWLERTAREIAAVMMSERKTIGMQNDTVRDIRFVLALTTASTTNVFKLWLQTEEAGQTRNSMRAQMIMQYIHGVIHEILLSTIIAAEKNPDYTNALRVKIFELAKRSFNRVVNNKIKLSVAEDDKGEAWTKSIQTAIACVMTDIKTTLCKAIDIAEKRLKLPALARILKPIAEEVRTDEEEWNTCLPQGELLYSEMLPSGHPLFFSTNGQTDTTTIASVMRRLDPFLETTLIEPKGDEAGISLCKSLCASIREQQTVTPDDAFSLCRPIRTDDPNTQIFLQCDRALRQKMNTLWIQSPQLMALAAVSAPLIIVKEESTFFLCCDAAGEHELRGIVDESHVADPHELLEIASLKMQESTLKRLCAIRVPIEALLPSTQEAETVAPISDIALPESPQRKKHLLREVFPHVFPGYRRYAAALQRLGVTFTDAKGSHIKVHFRDESRPAIHAYAFCKRYHSSLPIVYVQTELEQLGISESAFLEACKEA